MHTSKSTNNPDWNEAAIARPHNTTENVQGTLKLANELAFAVENLAEALLGAVPPFPTPANAKGPIEMDGILRRVDDQADLTRLCLNEAFNALERIKGALV